MSEIKLHDKVFEPYITKERIQASIEALAQKITEDYKDKKPLFIVVLNGAFMFASDLLKVLKFDLEVCFIKVSSYHGTRSTGEVTEIIGLSKNIENRPIIIVEDIIDTGNTIETLVNTLKPKAPSSIKIASMLLKPEAYKKDITIDYAALEIENKFVVGYGLDYDELGRNINALYKLKA